MGGQDRSSQLHPSSPPPHLLESQPTQAFFWWSSVCVLALSARPLLRVGVLPGGVGRPGTFVSCVWVCFIGSAGPRCRCAGLFHGARCELPDNPCVSQPCARGRVCVPKTQGYMCNCSLDAADAR